MHQRFTWTAFAALLVTTVLVTAPLTDPGSAQAVVPVGNIGKFTQNFREDFTTAASANGAFAKTYAKSWAAYPDGSGDGKYWSGTQISAHDGVLDVDLDGKHGAAGTFGTPSTAWNAVGGKFTVRARALGGNGNGAAFILWPTSNKWSDGEIDYPESNFEAHPMAHQHSMTPGKEANDTSATARVSWRNFHTYSIEWIPGKSVSYFIDDYKMATFTKDVPTTPHRFMFQTGNWGQSGTLQIDWVTTYTYKP